MEGYFMFQWEWFVYQMMGASFLSGGRPMGGIGFGGRGGGLKKIVRWRGHLPPMPPHYGKPWYSTFFEQSSN